MTSKEGEENCGNVKLWTGTAELRVETGRWCGSTREREYVGNVHSKRLRIKNVFCCGMGTWQRRER